MKNFNPTKQYPAQSGPYKVFVKDKGRWQQHKVARLQISVGNPKHNGEKFFALAEWAAARFDKTIVIVSDTLQRHNISHTQNISMNEATKISLQMGESWLKNNQDALNILSNKMVVHWDNWLSHPNFLERLSLLTENLSINEPFKICLHNKALEFSARHFLNPKQRDIEVSIKYILEELAAFSLMFSEEKAIDVYPGAWFKDIFDALSITGLPLASSFKDAECLRIDFVRNKAEWHKPSCNQNNMISLAIPPANR